MGGDVVWCGKPHPGAYALALQVAARIRGAAVAPARVLGIGDAVRTDLKSAAVAGVDALFVAGGLHRDELVREGGIDAVALAELLSVNGAMPVAVMQKLAW